MTIVRGDSACATLATKAGRLPKALLVAVLAGATVVATSFIAGPAASAHDEIESSSPADRSTIDEPISSAEIDFGEVIGESVELFLTYDPGGDADIVGIGGETTKTGDTTARLDFDEIEEQGTYFLQYLAPIPSDGHVMVGAISFNYGVATAIDEGENENVRSSTPPSRSRIDEPISTVTIEFDVEIGDDVTLSLVYDRGDGENFDELGGETERTGPRTAVLTFDEIEREGTYFVLYDTTVAARGDEIVGAISFTYGDPAGESSGFPILPFLAVAIPILAIGAWLTMRSMRRDIEDDGASVDAQDGSTPGTGDDTPADDSVRV